MSDLERFRLDLRVNAEASASVSAGEIQPSEAFGQLAFELISSSGELSGEIYSCRESGAHTNGARYRIDGYCIEDLAESDGYETISVFIINYGDSIDLRRLTKAVLDASFKEAVRFVSDAMRGYLSDLERSSPALDLVMALSHNRANVERVSVHLVTDSICELQAPNSVQLPYFDDISVSFRVWDINRLFEIQLSEKGHTPIVVDFVEREGFGIKCLPMPSRSDDYECYLAILKGDVLANLYQEFGARLLESNVRAFLQQSIKVNKGIRDTIREAPGMFLPYNNGLAATAKNVTLNEENGVVAIERVEDLQIVNGGQTTASLYHTRRKFKVSLEDVYVQMKLTVLRDEEKFETIVPSISRYANSQTKVSDLDLTANHRLLQELQRVAERTFAIDPNDPNVQTLWYFERVNGQYREELAKARTPTNKKTFERKYPKRQVIDKAKLAKFMMAYYAQPFWIARGAQKNYVEYIKSLDRDFPKRGRQESKPGIVYWKTVVANGILFATFEKLFGRKGQNPIGDSNLRAPTVAYAMSMLHERTLSRFDLEVVWKAQASPSALDAIFKEQLVWVYNRLVSEDGLVSERAKSPKTWEDFKNHKDDPFRRFDWSIYLLSEAQAKAFRASWSASDTGLNPHQLGELANLGIDFWNQICLLGGKGEIDDRDYTIATRIRGDMFEGRTPSNTLINKGIELLERLESRGVNVEQIRTENEAEEGFFDITKALVRLKDLSRSDWNTILSFEEYILDGAKITPRQWQGLRNTYRSLAERVVPSMVSIQESIACIDEVNRRFGKTY
jgi:hypothetical protein